MIRHAFPSLIITFCIPSTPNIRQTNIPKPIGHNKYAQYRYPSYIPKIGSKANNKYINCHTEWQNTERRFMIVAGFCMFSPLPLSSQHPLQWLAKSCYCAYCKVQ